MFEYELSKKTVYEWWTDLSGVDYVGKALKSVRVVRKDGDQVLVETKWKIMGMTKSLLERLTLISENHWVWEPTNFGIEITDDFRLESLDGKIVLTIDSKMRPNGVKGRLARMMTGPHHENQEKVLTSMIPIANP
jgi:hypothetical protein